MADANQKEMIGEFLNDPNLLDNIVKLIQTRGVIGERLPIMCLILTCCGRLVGNKETISTNAHFSGSSSIGKDNMINAVRRVVFNKDWVKYTVPTPTAIVYGQKKVNKKENGETVFESKDKPLNGDVILYIKDANQNWLNHDDNKLLLEDKHPVFNVTIKQSSVKIEFSKPIIIISTADTADPEQLLRRLPNIQLDSSEELTRKVVDKAIDNFDFDSEKNADNAIDKKIVIAQNAFYELKKVKVKAKRLTDKIKESFPSSRDDTRMRTQVNRFIDLIKFSAALHQRQREREGTVLLANEEDVRIAKEMFTYIYGDEADLSYLNQRQKDIRKKMMGESFRSFTVKKINQWKESGGVSQKTTYDDIKQLLRADKSIIEIEDKPSRYYYNNGKKIDFEIIVEGDREDIDNPEEDDEIIEEED